MAMTSRCNLHCVMCDHGIRKVEKQDFQPELIVKAKDFMASASLVDLTGLGEPMMSELFWEILDQFPVTSDSKDDEFVLMFNSNGTLLNQRNIERILKSRARKIRISLDSADPELFRLIRGTNLDPIVEKVRALMQQRDRLGRKYPRIGVEMTLMRANLHGMCEMIDLCSSMGVDFLEVWSLNQIGDAAKRWNVDKGEWSFQYANEMVDGLPKDELSKAVDRFYEHARIRDFPVCSLILGESRISHDSILQENTLLFGEESGPWVENSIRCSLPWKELRITYEGHVYACCWARKAIGDLRVQTLEEIWKSAAMQEMRSDLVRGVVPDLCEGASCSYVRGNDQKKWVIDPRAHQAVELVATAVRYSLDTGVHDLEQHHGRPLRWTNGHAVFHVDPQGSVGHYALRAKFWYIGDATFAISVNGNEVYRNKIPRRGLDEEIQLGTFHPGVSFTIQIESSVRKMPDDPRDLGVAMESLLLIPRLDTAKATANRKSAGLFSILSNRR
jgi:MoaA/NifB/PqqE/SkfB family radical SAM enzyme